MKTFFKVLLILVLAVLALKLLPLVFGLGCALFAGLIALAGAGLSIVAVVAGAILALVVLLSPLWLPVLVVLGVIALVRRSGNSPA